jgi:DNA-binding NtrC family response regulator
MGLVLVVDDKEMLRDSVGGTLVRAGLEVQTAESASEALEAIARRRPDAVVTDLKMPGMSGIELLEQVRKIDDELPVILMTAFATVETAVKALKLGAFDYITKPFEGDQLVIAVKRAVEHARLVRENAVLRSGGIGDSTGASLGGSGAGVGGGGRGLERLLGDSPAMRRVKEQVLAVAESHGTVLICGESGTGKEVVARAIHECSSRKGAAFLGVNCAALSESLLESELFGHERGSFTGADKMRKGRFELADRGSLLLDEISEVPTRVQAKLLRVLQERVIERVGSSMSIGVDVRIVATSNRDLPKAIERNEFRQDLFFRLNVLPIHLPPLRDRMEDIVPLARHFVARIAQRDGKEGLDFEPEAMAALSSYAWPGNVRELQNICERAAVLSRSPRIGRGLIEAWLTGPRGWSGAGNGTLGATQNGAAYAGNGVNGSHGALNGGNGANGAYALNGAGASNGVNGQGYGQGFGGVGSMPEPKVGVGDFGAGASGGAPGGQVVQVAGRVLEDIERDAIVGTLRRFNGHRQKTAQALGIGVRTLGLKLKKWKELSLVEATI